MGGVSGYIISRSSHCNSDFFSSATNSLLRWLFADAGIRRWSLFTPIRSKTTTLLRCARHLSVQRRCSCPLRRGDESAGKRSHRNHSSSPERVRLLQPLLPRPQERQRPATYSRSQTPESHPDEKLVQDDHFETDTLANMPRGLVYVAGWFWHHTGPSSSAI